MLSSLCLVQCLAQREGCRLYFYLSKQKSNSHNTRVYEIFLHSNPFQPSNTRQVREKPREKRETQTHNQLPADQRHRVPQGQVQTQLSEYSQPAVQQSNQQPVVQQLDISNPATAKSTNAAAAISSSSSRNQQQQSQALSGLLHLYLLKTPQNSKSAAGKNHASATAQDKSQLADVDYLKQPHIPHLGSKQKHIYIT